MSGLGGAGGTRRDQVTTEPIDPDELPRRIVVELGDVADAARFLEHVVKLILRRARITITVE